MFGIGTTELIVCMVICLILFGNRLPSVMRSLGQSARSFREGIHEMNEPTEVADSASKVA